MALLVFLRFIVVSPLVSQLFRIEFFVCIREDSSRVRRFEKHMLFCVGAAESAFFSAGYPLSVKISDRAEKLM
jgi:hypothetical protein